MGLNSFAPIADTSRRYRAGLGHPEVCRLLTRIEVLLEYTFRLTDNEEMRVFFAASNLETLAGYYWRDFNVLVGKPLPDPGCRPLYDAIYPFADRKPDFTRVLGYFHRVRQYVERLETKYGIGGAV